MMFSRRVNTALVLVAMAVFFVAPACGPRAASSAGASAAGERRETAVEYLEHRVTVPGETLSLIAEWYTGSSDNWVILAEHNPVIDAQRIEIGSTILVPELMLIRRDSLPKTFVAGKAARRQRAPAAQMKPIQPQPEPAPIAVPNDSNAPEQESATAPSSSGKQESLQEWQKRVREVLEINEQRREADPESARKHDLLEELLEE